MIGCRFCFNRALIVALLILACVARAARPGDFRVIGPGGGGAMFNPTISPHDSQTTLVSCDMTGAYITHDGGRSWRMFNLRGTVRFFAFDPIQPKTLYAEVNGLWRSTDDGESWKLIWPPPAAIQAVQMNSDHADEQIIAKADPVGEMVALAIDPADSRTLFVAGRQKQGAALFVSRDSGGTWREQARLSEAPRRIWVHTGTIFSAGPHGVAEVRGGQVTAHPSPAGITFTDISGGFPAQGPPVFYAVSEGGAFVSAS